MEVTSFTARRFGRFTLPARLAGEYSSQVLRVMSKCIVVRCEHIYNSDELEYVAISDHFREVAQGEMTPTYVWNFTSEGEFWCEELPRMSWR